MPFSEMAPSGDLEGDDRAATGVEWKLRKNATARSYSSSLSFREDMMFTIGVVGNDESLISRLRFLWEVLAILVEQQGVV